jgi:methyltransferase (TIGR00027 family)
MDDPSQASRTADRVAERRAAHQILDPPAIFDDPLALDIIRPEIARVLRETPRKFDSSPFDRYLRAFVSMRSRFAEDAFRQAYAHGVRQYVILGAGFDTSAYRHPFPDLRVWEIDHPATQAVKRARLTHAGIDVPPSLTFVSVDLSRTPVGDALAGAGFDPAKPAFVAWLGVAMYLDLPDIRTTLRFIGSLPAGTCVVFDYAVPPSSLNWLARALYGVMLRRLGRIGEPFKTFFDPATALTELKSAGFQAVEDLGPDDINAKYFGDRSDGLKVSTAGRIAKACK